MDSESAVSLKLLNDAPVVAEGNPTCVQIYLPDEWFTWDTKLEVIRPSEAKSEGWKALARLDGTHAPACTMLRDYPQGVPVRALDVGRAMTNPISLSTTLGIATWNIHKFGKSKERRSEYLHYVECIQNLFAANSWLEVVALQELNNLLHFEKVVNIVNQYAPEGAKLRILSHGPLLFTLKQWSNTDETEKVQITQHEFYALVARDPSPWKSDAVYLHTEDGRIIAVPPDAKGGFMWRNNNDRRNSETHYRPTVVHQILRSGTAPEETRTPIYVGVVHTSPEGQEFNRSEDFKQVASLLDVAGRDANRPFIILGDFYLSPEAIVLPDLRDVLQKQPLQVQDISERVLSGHFDDKHLDMLVHLVASERHRIAFVAWLNDLEVPARRPFQRTPESTITTLDIAVNERVRGWLRAWWTTKTEEDEWLPSEGGLKAFADRWMKYADVGWPPKWSIESNGAALQSLMRLFQDLTFEPSVVAVKLRRKRRRKTEVEDQTEDFIRLPEDEPTGVPDDLTSKLAHWTPALARILEVIVRRDDMFFRGAFLAEALAEWTEEEAICLLEELNDSGFPAWPEPVRARAHIRAVRRADWYFHKLAELEKFAQASGRFDKYEKEQRKRRVKQPSGIIPKLVNELGSRGLGGLGLDENTVAAIRHDGHRDLKLSTPPLARWNEYRPLVSSGTNDVQRFRNWFGVTFQAQVEKAGLTLHHALSGTNVHTEEHALAGFSWSLRVADFMIVNGFWKTAAVGVFNPLLTSPGAKAVEDRLLRDAGMQVDDVDEEMGGGILAVDTTSAWGLRQWREVSDHAPMGGLLCDSKKARAHLQRVLYRQAVRAFGTEAELIETLEQLACLRIGAQLSRLCTALEQSATLVSHGAERLASYLRSHREVLLKFKTLVDERDRELRSFEPGTWWGEQTLYEPVLAGELRERIELVICELSKVPEEHQLGVAIAGSRNALKEAWAWLKSEEKGSLLVEPLSDRIAEHRAFGRGAGCRRIERLIRELTGADLSEKWIW